MERTPLQAYLADTETRQVDFAAACGISQSRLSRIAARKRTPPVPIALRIEALTGGRVTAASLNPDVGLIEEARGVGERAA